MFRDSLFPRGWNIFPGFPKTLSRNDVINIRRRSITEDFTGLLILKFVIFKNMLEITLGTGIFFISISTLSRVNLIVKFKFNLITLQR